MKNSRYKIGLLFLGLTASMACNNELNVEPEQAIPADVALTEPEHIANLLTGAYQIAGRSDIYGGFLQMLSDLYGFAGQATWYGTFQQPRQVFNKRVLVDNSFVADYWLNAYELINATNLILDHIDVAAEDDRARIGGEAHFLRGLAYFDLARMFGSPYESGQSNEQLAVPLVLQGITEYANVDLTVARNTVEEVYNQVIADLNSAYESLPADNSFWAGKYAAKALLARVYLQQGNYQAARDAANEVIQDGGHVLTETFAQAFNNDANSTEDIFAIQVTSQSGDNELVVHYADEQFGGRGGDIAPDGYWEMFDSETDERATFYYESAYGDLLTSKYTNQFGDIPLIRLAEMYLIRAEANFRLGTAIGAAPVADINEIRTRANAELKTSVSLDDILLERELELAFEGFLIHDIKRTKQTIVITESVGGEPTAVSIPYDANRLVYPIPQREMDANNKLVQNPGYGS